MNKKINLPWPVLILFLIAAFLTGSIWQKQSFEQLPQLKTANSETQNYIFQPIKSEQPNLQVYMQSFNQEDKLLQANLAKTAGFFQEKISWQPNYYFTSTDQPLNFDDCIETPNNNFFCSPLGKPQINQQVRELCAWEIINDNQSWWKFVNAVAQNCNPDDIDQCWQVEAKIANLPLAQIQDCFSRQTIPIISNQIQTFKDKNIFETPTMIINNAQLPIYSKDSQKNLVVKIEDRYFQGNQINSPEYFIAAICAAIEKQIDICN